MHMVFYSVYDDGFTTCFIDEVAYYSLQLWSPGFMQRCIAVFYSKDSLQVDLVIAVGHVLLFIWIEPRALCYFNRLL